MKTLRKKVHPAWHIAWFSGGTLGGIALSVTIKSPLFAGLEVPIFAGLLLVYAIFMRRMPMLAVALLAGLLFGLWRGGLERQALTDYQSYLNKSVVLHGVVNEDVTYDTSGSQRVRIASVVISAQKLPGVVWVSTDETVEMKRGDYVQLEGRLSKGFGNIPAAMHDARIVAVQRPQPGDIARRIRDWFADGVRRAIPEPEASLSVGYLVGQKSALPEVLSEQLKVVGLTHAVVASGYNLTILVGFARRSLMRFSKYFAMLCASGLVVSFVLVTGFSPSMSRAGLVSLLSLAAWYYGRSIHPVVLLLFAATLTGVWRPAYVWGDIGWYLSFTAFTGVIVMSPVLKRYFFSAGKQFGIIRQTLLDTTSAQLLTLPIILYAFGQYASYALLANILVLPLVPLAMLLTFVAGVGGLALPGLASWLGWPAQVILAANIYVIGWVAGLPGASGEVSFGLTWLVGSYVLLLMAMVYLWRKTHYDFRVAEQETTLF